MEHSNLEFVYDFDIRISNLILMCGIAGIYNFDEERTVDGEKLRRMTEIISHRGPDNQGVFIDRNCGLGLRRLTIIDTTEQPQPILHNEDKTLFVTYNGEIYNFPQLKEELLRKGHRFYTATDTEMILHLYEEEGVDCVRRLNGMFAIAIWDQKKQELFLSRDHLGIKPLYYCEHGRSFYFASEIKAILENENIPREVAPGSFYQYLHYRYTPAPRTMFKGIYKLLPGHWMLVNKEGVEIEQFWNFGFGKGIKGLASTDICSRIDTDQLDEEGYVAQAVQELLTESIKMQLISDVPLGAFLSGGIDSSIVVGVMSQIMKEPVKTFSVGFLESEYDETYFARQIAKRFKTDHQEVVVTSEDVKLLPKIIWHLDEPLADPAAIPTFILSNLARKKVKVVLTGEGGDELFAGYKEDFPSRLASVWPILPESLKKGLTGLVRKMPDMKGKTPLYRGLLSREERAQHILRDAFRFVDVKALLDPKGLSTRGLIKFQAGVFDKYWEGSKNWDWLSRMLYLETKLWLPDDPLMKVDKMTMANSLEARVPILDYRLVELAAKIPSEVKMKNRIEKYVLRKAFEEILPWDIFKRKKHAFDVPVRKWLRNELREMVDKVLSKGEVEKQGLLDSLKVRELITLHYEGKKDFAYEIWNLLNFSLWHKIYIERGSWEGVAI